MTLFMSRARTRVLGLVVTASLAGGCRPFVSFFRVSPFPAFPDSRIERVGEPVTVRGYTGGLKLGRGAGYVQRLDTIVNGALVRLEALPVVLEILPPTSWSNLAGSVTLISLDQPSSASGAANPESLAVLTNVHSDSSVRAYFLYPRARRGEVQRSDTVRNATPTTTAERLRVLYRTAGISDLQPTGGRLRQDFYLPGVDSVSIRRRLYGVDSAIARLNWRTGSLPIDSDLTKLAAPGARTVLVVGGFPGGDSSSVVDSIRVLGQWVNPRNPLAWDVRVALLADSIPGIRSGELRDSTYWYLHAGDWPATRAAEKSLLTQLDVGGTGRNVRGAPVLLACRKRFAGHTSPCFRPGDRYEVRVAVEGRPVAIYPFRIERRNRLLSLGIGLFLVVIFLGASAG